MAQPRISIKVKNWNQTQHGGGTGGGGGGGTTELQFNDADNSQYLPSLVA